MTISEIELFKAVDLWATEKCKRNGLPVNGHEKRGLLGENLVHAIRFPAMEKKEFASVVTNSEILTSEEVVCIIKYFNSVTLTAGSPEKERIGALLSCCRISVCSGRTTGCHNLAGTQSFSETPFCLISGVNTRPRLFEGWITLSTG